jgi:hypothetical protein
MANETLIFSTALSQNPENTKEFSWAVNPQEQRAGEEIETHVRSLEVDGQKFLEIVSHRSRK